MSGFAIWLAVALIFAPIGAVMAALITYQEYRQHRPGKGQALRDAMLAGAFAFAVLFGLTLATGWAIH
jgi:hypothetical protein